MVVYRSVEISMACRGRELLVCGVFKGMRRCKTFYGLIGEGPKLEKLGVKGHQGGTSVGK